MLSSSRTMGIQRCMKTKMSREKKSKLDKKNRKQAEDGKEGGEKIGGKEKIEAGGRESKDVVVDEDE